MFTLFCNSIRLLDDVSLLLANFPATTVKFGSQLSKHARTVSQCIVSLSTFTIHVLHRRLFQLNRTMLAFTIDCLSVHCHNSSL